MGEGETRCAGADKIRRLGSNLVHCAGGPIPWERLKWIGQEFDGLAKASVFAACGANLRGTIVKMEKAQMSCPRCRRVLNG